MTTPPLPSAPKEETAPSLSRLASARISRGWTQQQVADQLGTTGQTVSRWERGVRRPEPYARRQLCRLFGLSEDELGLLEAPAAPAPVPQEADAASLPQPSPRRTRSPLRRWLLLLLLLVSLLILPPVATTLPAPRQRPPALDGVVAFESSGQGTVADQQGLMDELQIDLLGLATPAHETGYYAWMAKASGSVETRWQPLGWLTVSQRTAMLLYRSPQHRNLLVSSSRFLITQEQTTTPPLQPSTIWVAQAAICAVPTPHDPHHYSLLDHLQHLLAADPALERLHLAGGLVLYLAANTEAVLQAAAALVPDWRAGQFAEVRARLLCLLDYLDGSAGVGADIPAGTPFLASLPAARVGLLTLFPNETPPGYVLHTDLHLEGVAEAIGATAFQRRLAETLRTALNAVELALSATRQDGRSLLRLTTGQLAQPASLSVLVQLTRTAQDAAQGSAGHPGVQQISQQMPHLATFSWQRG